MKIIRFGDFSTVMVTLPILEKSHEQGSGNSKMVFIDTPDGQVDLLGSERARRALFNLNVGCRLLTSSKDLLQSQIDALKSMRGKKDKLWGELPDGNLRWTYARLDGISGMNDIRSGVYLPITIAFMVQPQYWNGSYHDAWSFDDGHYFDSAMCFDSGLTFSLDSSPKTVSVSNGGNIEVENTILTITAAVSSITELHIKRLVGGVTMEHLKYTGTIMAGQSLVIDCGTQSIKNNGVSDFAHFERGSDHKYDGWLKLEPGSNSIQITRTGGGTSSSIEFNFYDAWA